MFLETFKKEGFKMNIKQWMKDAEQALPLLASAKEGSEAKQKAFNALAFGAVQILMNGTIQDEKALAVAVSKEGKYQALRGAVSKAKPLASELKTLGFVTYKTKKEEKRFSRDEVKNAKDALFSVSSVYASIRKGQEALTEGQAPAQVMTDDDYINLALEQEENKGLTLKTVKGMSAELQADMINQGKVIHGEAMQAQAQAIAATIEETCNNAFAQFLEANQAQALNWLEAQYSAQFTERKTA